MVMMDTEQRICIFVREPLKYRTVPDNYILEECYVLKYREKVNRYL